MEMMKWILVLVVSLLAIGINLPDNMLARYGVEPTFLTVALAAIALTGMIVYRKIALVMVMMLLLVGANLPSSVADSWNLDRDILLAALIALIIIPFVQNQLEGR
jgi:hypothetical protein